MKVSIRWNYSSPLMGEFNIFESRRGRPAKHPPANTATVTLHKYELWQNYDWVLLFPQFHFHHTCIHIMNEYIQFQFSKKYNNWHLLNNTITVNSIVIMYYFIASFFSSLQVWQRFFLNWTSKGYQIYSNNNSRLIYLKFSYKFNFTVLVIQYEILCWNNHLNMLSEMKVHSSSMLLQNK